MHQMFSRHSLLNAVVNPIISQSATGQICLVCVTKPNLKIKNRSKMIYFRFWSLGKTPAIMGTTSQLHFFWGSPFCDSNFAFLSFWPFLTSTVHKFPDIGCGHDLVGAQIISELATYGHDNGHDEVGKCWNDAHLEKEKENIIIT